MVLLQFQGIREGLSDEVTFELRPEQAAKGKLGSVSM